jgi:peptide/nickel transport system substrate-binding protein
MAEGHAVEDGGRRVSITLRPGLKFHDGEPVRARDAVSSIKRWAQRDAMGQALMAATDELVAEDDRRIAFRLKRPFPLLFDALAKPSSPCCFIMPERIASTDAGTPIRDIVGSGPFRWVANERVPGSRVVYARNQDYVPVRAARAVDLGSEAGEFRPRRVECDPRRFHRRRGLAERRGGLVGAAERRPAPALGRNRNIVVEQYDPTGLLGLLRFNHLHRPSTTRASGGRCSGGSAVGLHVRRDRHRQQPLAR